MKALLSWCVLFLVSGMAQGIVSVAADEFRTAAQFAPRVDELLDAKLAAAGVAAAPRSDDGEFLRRVYLDLVGRLPPVGAVRRFLDDPRADKRERVIDDLLASPRHATHLANTWRQFMLPGNIDPEDLPSVAGVQNWLRRQFAQNLRYDRVVSDFLVATGGGDSGPALYYTALELQPEKLAASTARIFLGLHLECAQCHKHPYDKWTQEDFWGYAAFFAQLAREGEMQRAGMVTLVDKQEGEVTLPDSDTVIPPRYPDGRLPAAGQGGTRRVQLAIWMASRENVFLARAAVNRVWAHLFGRGLIEPVDDLSEQNAASHPELLQELADYFVASGFDLRELFRALAYTRAYQRTSRRAADFEAPSELFAHMEMKTLTSEQLYDCLSDVLLPAADAPRNVPAMRGIFDPRRLAFAAQMQMRGQNATEYEAGVLQALTMLNGDQLDAAARGESSALLAGLESPLFDDGERVETLFLATLCRFPTQEERSQFATYVERGAAAGRQREALSDVLWAMLNSAEFVFNH